MREARNIYRLPKPTENKSIDMLVDRFVAKVNAGEREPIAVNIYQTPSSVLVGEPDEYGRYDWMIKPYPDVDWVGLLEHRLGHRFPAAYRSLIARYIFPGFHAGGIYFFGNTPEGTDWSELRETIFVDPGLREILLPSGFVQFARQDIIQYDPVCFDTNRESGGDCPVVQIDHEGVLCANTIDIVGELAPSFRQLLEDIVSG